ncbi:MAG: phosphate acetyltransferase [Balneolaceae bacterium]|nr:phosphate acetyltransferase [Balneolaceae bacterium]
MKVIKQIRERAASQNKRIVLPRSSDPRVVEAAKYLERQALCEVILIQNENAVVDDIKGIELIIPGQSKQLETYARDFYERRKHKGISIEEARQILLDPLYFGAAMVAAGDADGCVAGSVSTTGDVLRAAIQTIGLQEGSEVVSSIFLMSFEDGRNYTYGDCAVVPYPNADQLATIAADSANTHQRLTGEVPKVAMLSFSTKGSAEHERIELVRAALQKIKNNNPDLMVDGEMQFDAAIIENVAQRKAPASEVAGQANVFIYPNLDAGNIAYKITERLAGATATGPVIQGLAKPMMDLSRGCSWEDIVNTVCVCSLMSER